MPLYLEPLPRQCTKGSLLAWLLDAGQLKKNEIGEIAMRGQRAVVEVPARHARTLVESLDGSRMHGRGIRVWFQSKSDEGDPRVAAHFNTFRGWLDLESEAQAERIRTAAAEGASRLGPLVLRDQDIGLGSLHLLTLGFASPMKPLPRATRPRVGAPIELSTGVGDSREARRGVVTRVEPNAIVLALSPPLPDWDEDGEFTIEPAEDETALRRARLGLRLAEHAMDGSRLAHLRDVLLGFRPPTFREVDFQSDDLNDSQNQAIACGLGAEDVSVIHGPPGTGKTTTVVALILEAVKRGESVLACAPSNLAVDNIVERLRDQGTNVVRLGHPVRVLESVRDATLSAQVRRHKGMKLVKKYRAEAMAAFKKAGSWSRAAKSKADRRALRDEAKSLLDDARSAEREVIEDVLNEAAVICATNTGVHVGTLGSRRFDLLVIDEACQCTESDCWIPIARAKRVVFAGDPWQLPPTVISQTAERDGFAVSLPERLLGVDGMDEAATLLDVQYRMHEEIMSFSSAEFYDGRLRAHPSVATHLLSDLPEIQSDDEQTTTALHFIDTSGALYDDVRDDSSGSTANPDEARLAIKKAKDLIGFGLAPEHLAILTPYAAQVQAITDARPPALEAVEVGTIDGFQGREKEAIIISLVRSNTEGKVGFLADTRRMNVALTRARRKLYVIADSATISAHPFYARLLEHFGALDAYHVVWEEEE